MLLLIQIETLNISTFLMVLQTTSVTSFVEIVFVVQLHASIWHNKEFKLSELSKNARNDRDRIRFLEKQLALILILDTGKLDGLCKQYVGIQEQFTKISMIGNDRMA